MREISFSLGVVSDKLNPLQSKLGCHSPSAAHSHPLACFEPPWGADPAPEKNLRPFWKGYFWPQQLFEPAHIPSPGAGAVSHGKRMAQGSRCGRGLGIGSSLTRPSPPCCSRHQPQPLVRMAVLSLCRGMGWGYSILTLVHPCGAAFLATCIRKYCPRCPVYPG